MKIATYKDGSRDGQLVVVSRDLTMAHYAAGVAGRLQQVLDDWNFLSPQLQEISQTLNHGKARHAFAFDPRSCMAPLPRAFHFASANPGGSQSASGSTAVRVRRSDALLGACEPLPVQPPPTNSTDSADEGSEPRWSVGAELAVIIGDLAAGAAAEDSLAAIRLVTACAIWQPLADEPDDTNTSIASFCPVAVTTDELGAAWHDALHELRLQMLINGQRVPADEARRLTTRDIGHGLASCAALLGLRAGSIFGTGFQASATVSATGGDSLRLGADGPEGESLFGAISAHLESRR